MKAGDRLYGEAVERYRHRHRVKPAISGWAQVSRLAGEVDMSGTNQTYRTHPSFFRRPRESRDPGPHKQCLPAPGCPFSRA
jgi:hypothetical protein